MINIDKGYYLVNAYAEISINYLLNGVVSVKWLGDTEATDITCVSMSSMNIIGAKLRAIMTILPKLHLSKC